MAATSIHIKPCKIGSSERHNERRKELSYVRQDLTKNNESWRAFDYSLSQHLEKLKKLVKEKTGRSLQKKATPIREGVIVIAPYTTMDQLKDFALACHERWSITVTQIHIHKDEGHCEGDQWKPNLHAHIIFDWIDYRTGKSVKMNKGNMSDMQTLLSQSLKMERGKESDKRHLSAMEYKAQQIEKDIRKAQIFEESIRKSEFATSEPLQDIVKNYKPKREQKRDRNTEHSLSVDIERIDSILKNLEEDRLYCAINGLSKWKESLEQDLNDLFI